MWWRIVLENLIPILFAIVTPLLVVLGRDLLAAIAKKYKLQVALEYEDKVESWVQMGINAAEKASLNALKSGNKPTPGEEKLKSVVEFVNAQLMAHSLPQKGGEAIAKLVDAKLMEKINPPTSSAAVLAGKQLNG